MEPNAGALFDYLTGSQLAQINGSHQIDIDRILDIGKIQIHKCAAGSDNAGYVGEHIDSSIHFHDRGDNMLAVIDNGDICLDKSNFSFFFQFCESSFICMTTENNDFISTGEKFFSSGKPNFFGSTSNNNDLVHENIPLSFLRYCLFYNKIISIGFWNIFIRH